MFVSKVYINNNVKGQWEISCLYKTTTDIMDYVDDYALYTLL